MKYDSSEEFNHRLRDTVIFYKGVPVLCRGIAQVNEDGVDGPWAYLYSLPGLKESIFVPWNDPDITYNRFPLGYCNLSKISPYISRKPARQYLQGLNAKSVYIPGSVSFDPSDDMAGTSPPAAPPQNLNWQRLYRTRGLFDCLTGYYPSVESVLDSLSKSSDIKSRAFSRRLAVSRDPAGINLLLYKGERVGYNTFDSVTFGIGSDFSWLRETLEEEAVKFKIV